MVVVVFVAVAFNLVYRDCDLGDSGACAVVAWLLSFEGRGFS